LKTADLIRKVVIKIDTMQILLNATWKNRWYKWSRGYLRTIINWYCHYWVKNDL
jgi:hypothetical protein